MTKRKPFPYIRVAKLWARGKTIESISHAIGRYQKGADDPLHTMRVFLTRMHAGYKDAKGRTVKLPHRVSRAAVKAATKAGALSKPKPKPRRKPVQRRKPVMVRKPVAKKSTPKVKAVVVPTPKPEAAA